jgi:alkylation response protein AidB-like acyl-CoA dehydrogenase
MRRAVHLTTVAARRSALAAAAVSQARALSFEPRIREYQFLLEDVLGMYDHYKAIGKGDDANKEFVDSMLEECSKVCKNTFFPLYQSGDAEGCVLKDGNVTTPKGYIEAYKTYAEGGWIGLSSEEKYGGQAMPQSVSFLAKEMMATSNWSFFMYPGLSSGAMNTLASWASDAQKETYLTKLISAEWSGTMCLTEPQCGTDLGQVKTRAEPQEDGTYKLTGQKIFISAGEHDMTDNIIHIVLARLPDAPAGTKGISLFIVPKHVIKADGSLEKKKNLTCIAIEKKMGIKASATAQLAFDGSVGYMIGQPHTGMKQMFTFMNTARIGTAVQGVAHAELAFQNALSYARERTSMRSLSGTKNADKPADLIIHHPGVKFQILFAKSIAESGRCFIMEMSKLVDKIDNAKTPAEAKEFDDELGFLTPIAKGLLTELGVEAASHGVQTWGGHGFIAGNGMEQIMRDARIATLYEGTTGVQAMDLIGRKVLMSKTKQLPKLQAKINALAKQHMFSGGELGKAGRKLFFANLRWKMATPALMAGAARDRNIVGSAAVDYLYFSGYMLLGYYNLKMATAASKKLSNDADGFYQTKIDMCDFYFGRIFPRINTHNEIMLTAPTSMMKIEGSKLDGL